MGFELDLDPMHANVQYGKKKPVLQVQVVALSKLNLLSVFTGGSPPFTRERRQGN
jgi:hypothetical protein